MRFNSVLISSFLLVSVGPSLTVCRRTDRRSQPYSGEFTTNFAGAELAIDHGAFYSVIGMFTIPEISSSSSNNSPVSAWVGINGDGTCGDLSLRAGVTIYDSPSGPVYNAWYDWFSQPPINFTSLTFSAGDVIGVAVGAPVNTTYGLVIIENSTKQQATSENISSTHASGLCGQTAEWIVETFPDNPIPNFSPIAFTDVRAYTLDGQTYGPQNATIINLVNVSDTSEVLTSVLVTGDSVTIKHV
ncbi:peptidase G1 [Boletus edulis BED1]|uniref:Peptidase G1 n=1 Tax=Boletus edulis BED1 TaxID=1328754 RepID=A0AAD4C8T7_BOLED|nr:peptidase G1 [Boletus edulis BED1]